MNLYRTHPDFAARRQHAQLLADAHLGAHRGSGHHRAVALDGERAVERQAEEPGRPARIEALELARDRRAQFVQARAGYRRNRDDRRTRQTRAVGQQFDLVANFTQARGIGKVGLGDDEDAALDAEQMKDVEMLLALRHHAVVGRDREQHQVDAVRAGQHVADETLVAGDVDHAGARAVGQREIGEAQVDRNPAFLFFLEAVGVLAGERLDKRGLAVIDMAGGADDGMGDSVMGDGGGHGAKVETKLTPRGGIAKRAPRRRNVRTKRQ